MAVTVSRASLHRFPWVENRFVRDAGYGPFHGEILVVRNRTASMGTVRRFVNMRGSRREREALRSAISMLALALIVAVVVFSLPVTDDLYSKDLSTSRHVVFVVASASVTPAHSSATKSQGSST